LYHVINLPEGKHTIKVVVKGEKRHESKGTNVYISEVLVFRTSEKACENFKFSFQK